MCPSKAEATATLEFNFHPWSASAGVRLSVAPLGETVRQDSSCFRSFTSSLCPLV